MTSDQASDESGEDLKRIAEALPALALQVKESNERQGRLSELVSKVKTLGWWLLVSAVVNIVAVAGISVAGWQILELSHKIDSCINPEGTCFQRSQARQNIILQSAVESFVLEINKDNQRVSSARDDLVAVKEREAIIAEREARLKELMIRLNQLNY